MKLIQIGKNGLHPREAYAVSEMEKHFQDSWQAYSSLVVTDDQGPMEVDLLIITSDRILLVEIKDWNGKLTSYRGEWHVNGRSRGGSPFNLKKAHALRISKLLHRVLKDKVGYSPLVEAHVVLSGSSSPEELPENEMRYVHSLETFLKIRKPAFYTQLCTQPAASHEEFFERYNHPRPNSVQVLKAIDNFFCNSKGHVQPKRLKIAQYTAQDTLDWEPENQLYREFLAQNLKMEKDVGLVRQWDFPKLGILLGYNEVWARIVSREHTIHGRARIENPRLEQLMLRPAAGLDLDMIQSDFAEAFELKYNMKRFDRYLSAYSTGWSVEQRADLVRALLTPFAELHGMGMAHRDIDCHNLWYSPDSATLVTSSYFAAFIPDEKTVKDIRSLITTARPKLPEEELAEEGCILDPFRIDVYLLAQVAHRICFAEKRMERIDNIAIWAPYTGSDPFNGKLDEFFVKAFDWEATARHKDASEMLAHFNRLTQTDDHLINDSREILDAISSGSFVKQQMSVLHLMSKFPPMPGEALPFGNTISYRYLDGEDVGLLKFWQNVSVSPKEPGVNRRILRMRKRIEKTLEGELPIAPLLDYGLLEAGGLYIATRYEPGQTWKEFSPSAPDRDARLQLSKRLCEALTTLHQHEVYHGDLHPENVIFKQVSEGTVEQDCELLFIDVLDYGNESEPYNVSYGPANPACTDGFGRDRFAAYQMVRELFEQDMPSELAEELERANRQPDQVPLSLKPLLEALTACIVALAPTQSAVLEDTVPTFALTMMQSDLLLDPELLSKDDTGYFLGARVDRLHSNNFRFYITGSDTSLTVVIDLTTRQIVHTSLTRNLELSKYISAQRDAFHRITENITVARGEPKRPYPDPLVNYLLGLDPVIDMMVKQSPNKDVDEQDYEIAPEDVCRVAPKQIWNTLVNSESDHLLRLEVAEGEVIENEDGHLVIPYVSRAQSWADNFDRGDTVNVALGNDERYFGKLVTSEIRDDVLVINPSRGGMLKRIQPGNQIVFESQRTKSSRDRRANALARVLEGRSKITRLPDYFDSASGMCSKPIDQVPEESTIRARYDGTEDGSVRFNARQVDAFQRVISEGPVSVLQGPPGTGKTEFVSKLIHYLYENDLAQNILLVGQSNATVDNVALKARELCLAMDTQLTIVRVGIEASVDPQLLHAHPSAIQRKIQNKFHREYDQRINALSAHLMLSPNFVSLLSSLHRTLYPLMAHLRALNASLAKIDQKAAQGTLAERRESLLTQIRTSVQRITLIVESNGYDFEIPDANDPEFWLLLSRCIAREHEVGDIASLNRLNHLIALSQEWIDVLASGEANYDRFLVKTSQLVCGTLVGIGYKNLEINESEFDWVIVDEAGRAQASELMIALQSAKRVLLVGDHHQLPPHYEATHLKAVSKYLSVPVSEVAKTDFERAFSVNNGITLDTQYRMIKPISDIVSTCFYADEKGVGGLKTGRADSPQWFNELPYPLNYPVTWIDSGEGAKRTGESSSGRKGHRNEHEVEVILHLIKMLCTSQTIEHLRQYRTEEKPYPVGIITMYQQQKALLKSELSKAEWATDIRDLIKIDTVDSYQGQENRLIFLSLVRDNDKTNQGFLGDTPRINVALSRAQERLVVVGARAMWRIGNCDSALAKVLSFVETQAKEQPQVYEIVDGTRVIEGY